MKLIKKSTVLVLIISLLMTICMPTMVSVTAATEYNLWIGDTQVTGENADNILGDNTVSYDATTNTITLNNATITGGGNTAQGWGIKYNGNGDLNIIANGTNVISDIGTRTTGTAGIVLGGTIGEYSGTNFSMSDYIANLNIIINEGASLTVSGGKTEGGYYPTGCGICLWQNGGNINVSGEGNLVINSGNSTYSYGILSTGDIIFDSTGKTTINCINDVYYSCGISAYNVIMNSGEIEVNSGDAQLISYGISTIGASYYGKGDITINNATVTVKCGTIPTTGSTSSWDRSESYALFIEKDFTINGGSLLAISSNSGDVTMALSKAPILETEGAAGASENIDGSGAVVYNENNNEQYKWFKTPWEEDVQEIIKGDMNNDKFINSSDAAMVLDKFKNNNATAEDFARGDMDNNDILNATDAAMILDIFKNS